MEAGLGPGPRIAGIAAEPASVLVGHEETVRFVERWLGDRPGVEMTDGEGPLGARELLARLGVGTRRVSAPLWDPGDRRFVRRRPPVRERYHRYLDAAVRMSARASERALLGAGIGAGEVGAVVLACTSESLLRRAALLLHGPENLPMFEARLREALGLAAGTPILRRSTYGSAGGAAGLREAAALALGSTPGTAGAAAAGGRPGTVLVVAVELLSWIFGAPGVDPGRPRAREGVSERERAALIFACLVGDGAAAAVVRGGGGGSSAGPSSWGPEVIGAHSSVWPATEEYLRYEPDEEGFVVRIRPSLPDLVRERAGEDLERAAGAAGLAPAVLDHRLVHPHSAAVLDAYSEAWGLPEGALGPSREVLGSHGNMSAPTVFFVLERLLGARSSSATPGGIAAVSALGPGISSEHVFLNLG